MSEETTTPTDNGSSDENNNENPTPVVEENSTPPEGNPPEPTPNDPPASEDPPPQPKAEPKDERVVPEADGYTIPEGAPEGLGALANSLGYTQEQLDGSLEAFGKFNAATIHAEKLKMQADGLALVESWGDVKETNKNVVKQAMAQVDPDGQLTQILKDTGWINHPVVLNHFLTIGSKLQEGGFVKGITPRNPKVKERAHRMYPDNAPK